MNKKHSWQLKSQNKVNETVIVNINGHIIEIFTVSLYCDQAKISGYPP